MNKSILASVIFTTLLSGCGSSGGGSPSLKTYSWQMVKLVSFMTEDEAKDSQCIIYADSVATEDKVITASVATSDYNILYHYPDGSVSDIYSADGFSDGLFTINVEDIPDDGYVSLEEVYGSDVYMFSVEKSLLSDLVINVGSGATGDCYSPNNQSIDYRDIEQETDFSTITVSPPALADPNSNPYLYYQTSYERDALAGQQSPTDIPVRSPLPTAHDVLVTRLVDNTELSHYGFFDDSFIYYSDESTNDYLDAETARLTELESSLYWSFYNYNSIDDLDFSESDIYALHDDIIYFWQLLSSDEALNVTSDLDEVSHWSAYFVGEVSSLSWEFESFIAFDSDGSEISYTLPYLEAVNSIEVVDDCDIEGLTVDYCVDTENSYDSEDFKYQRTYLQMNVPNSNSPTYSNLFTQSIYAPVSNSPILLASSRFTSLDNITINNLELNLIDSDADSIDAIQYLMSQSMDEVALGDDVARDSFYDANGFVATGDERDALELAIFKSTTLTVKTEISSAD